MGKYINGIDRINIIEFIKTTNEPFKLKPQFRPILMEMKKLGFVFYSKKIGMYYNPQNLSIEWKNQI